mgnify:FL=1
MRNILIALSLVFLFSNSVQSAPNYDPNYKTVVYDVADDVALRKKLEDNFDKKYPPIVTKTKDSVIYTYNYPEDAYYKEVIVPYDRLKKNNNPF